MKTKFKRIAAYMIDMIIVSVIVFGLSNIKQVNYQADNYDRVSKEYQNYVKKYEKVENNYNKAKNDYKEKKINKKQYSDKKNEYNEYKKDYEKKIKKYNYNISKNSVISTIISMAIVIAYFAIFQFSLGGQTLGKKIMKLRVVKAKEKELNIFNYLIRCAILNGVIVNLLLVIFVNTLDVNSFYMANYIVSNIQSIIEIVIIIMIFMTNDSRGLHDYIAGTKVIEIDALGNEIDKSTEEIEYIYLRKKVKKEKNNSK